MKRIIVLDTFALLSFFHKERGWQKVEAVLRQAGQDQAPALLSIINLGEFYYILRRKVGEAKAAEALDLLGYLPVNVCPVDQTFVLEAARIKATRKISYADAFCVNLAVMQKGEVVTGDPEFREVEDLVRIEWL
ncbi:MAG: type II toxin-antitoxin system VapC family toxin [Armatimonadetes bacterium]|nr:type II toxin-antitoxin system VapC family toxin [Armatimonadota bacterium]